MKVQKTRTWALTALYIDRDAYCLSQTIADIKGHAPYCHGVVDVNSTSV